MKISHCLGIACIAFLFTACGFSEEEKSAAIMACECSKDKTIFGVRDCIRDAADSMKIDVEALSYDRAFKDVCHDTYQRIMDFSKGKTKGVDETPAQVDEKLTK